jgi:hypothetical protein
MGEWRHGDGEDCCPPGGTAPRSERPCARQERGGGGEAEGEDSDRRPGGERGDQRTSGLDRSTETGEWKVRRGRLVGEGDAVAPHDGDE